jgi:hypothetical protein
MPLIGSGVPAAPKWACYSDSVLYYRKHLQSHEQGNEQIQELSAPSSVSFAFSSFILKRDEPLAALDFFGISRSGNGYPRASTLFES